jgi:hypothetical protein
VFRGGRQAQPAAPSVGPSRDATALDSCVDLGCELLVRSFGTWTILYHLGLVLDLRTTPLLLVTAVLTVLPLLVPWSVRAVREVRAVRAAGPTTAAAAAVAGAASNTADSAQPGALADELPARSPDGTVTPRGRRLPGALLVSAGLAVAAVPALTGPDARYPLGWMLAVASVLVLVLALVVAGPVAEQPPPATPGPARVAGSLFVLAVLGAAATASLYTLTKSYDDVFYVNKAVFVAEHGSIPVRDTVYSDQALPAIRGAGSVPMQSLEVLQGAVGHVLGIRGADTAYLVATPIAVAVAVWVLWWLVREWSRGPAIVAFVVGAAYLVWGMYLAPGAAGSIATSSLLLRGSWQGKVVLVCAALPFCHLALTRWARGRRPRDLWLLFLVGAGTVGLASTALFLLPPIAGAALVALAVTRRPGWWGPLGLAAYPVGAGIVVSRISAGEDFGEPLRTAASSFHGLFGQGGWGWLSALALLLGAWAVRRGAGQVVAAAAVVATVVVLGPAAPELVDDLTGAGPILWRLGWIPPLAALLGVLAAAPLGATDVLAGRTRRAVERVPLTARTTLGWLVVAATLACIVLVGRPVWAHDAPLRFADRPVWKWTQPDLRVARAIADGATGPGSVLAPREVMSALALTTSRVHAVDPRSFFLPALQEDLLAHEARRRLSYVMRPGLPWVFRSFPDDLRVVGVGTVCLDRTQAAARSALVRSGWWYDSRIDVPGHTCWRPTAVQEGAR